MNRCMEVAKDEARCRPPLLKVFALEALFNILSVRPGRVEFLNTSQVPEQGELRNAAVEKFFEARFSIFIKYACTTHFIFVVTLMLAIIIGPSTNPAKTAAVFHCRFLKVIPNETINVYTKGKNKPEEVKKPLASSIDLVEVNIKVCNVSILLCSLNQVVGASPAAVVACLINHTQCLAVLAQEIETKEQLALLVVQSLLFALDVSQSLSAVWHVCHLRALVLSCCTIIISFLQICQDEANINLHGLKLMYNLCYRSVIMLR